MQKVDQNGHNGLLKAIMVILVAVIFNVSLIMQVMIFAVLVIIIFILFLKVCTPPLNKENVNYIGKKCRKLLGLEHLNISFKLKKNIKTSRTEVIKKGEKYTILIRDHWMQNNTSEIIHELTHIQKGQSDRLKDLPKNWYAFFINIYYDSFYAWPNEVRYFLWTRKNCR